MILLDTSFLFGYYHEQDVHHVKAKEIAKTVGNNDLSIPQAVFEELMTVTTNKIGSHQAVALGNLLLSPDYPIEIIPPSEGLFHASWQTFQKLSPHDFSFIDCLLITLSKQYQCPVLTFDKALSSALSSPFLTE